MVRPGKRIKRNRLIKWAVPYLRDGRKVDCQGGCIAGDGCILCDAEINLTEEEWKAIVFYGRVGHSLVNIAPMAEKAQYSLPISEIHSALIVWNYPPDDWGFLADTADIFHRYIIGEFREPSDRIWERGDDITEIPEFIDWMERHGHYPIEDRI